MKTLRNALLGVVGVLALTATGASAAVVCNEQGDCWRVKEKHTYPPAVNLRIYEDDWKWADTDSSKYRWREPGAGRGYWDRGGVWIGF